MARKNKGDIKLNKVHNGKEFTNSFHFVGLVKPVRRKEQDGDSWYDVEIFDTTKTQTNKDRRVLQFNIETAFKNELKVELAGMEQSVANVYSSVDKKNHKIDWADRYNKEKYPNETYHLIETDWDKTERFGKVIQKDMWVEVKGHYEFDKFKNNDGEEIKTVKRIIDQVFPLRNGEVEITGLKENDIFRAYDAEVEGNYLGMGKADKDGKAVLRVGWLNPEGGKLYICKVENEVEGKRAEQTYTDGKVENGRITITNNVDSQIRVPKATGGYDYITYVRDFKSEDFKEINSFEMQVGIKSTYQDENTLDTKINGVYLDYGKEKSTPKDVELVVYYKEAEEGKTPLATAFSRLNRLDFFVAEGIDNNRAEFSLVEVQETDDDNPFADVEEKVSDFEQVSSGTKKGLEVLRYIVGTFKRGLLTEEEISDQTSVEDDPFADVQVSDGDLPF
ncbi:hypothetical protein AAHH67_16030 [Niallia circulans]